MTQTRENPVAPSGAPWLNASLRAALSWVPVAPVMAIYDSFSAPLAEDPLFTQFITELKSQLLVSGGSADFVGKFIPAYVSATLNERLRLDQLIDFAYDLRQDLGHAYADPAVPQATRDEFKASALQRVLKSIRPHGLKYIQTLRPVDPNSWVGMVVDSVRSDLPALPIDEIRKIMMREIKATSPQSKYAKDFDKYFKITKVLGAGTIGIVAEVEWRLDNGSIRTIAVKLIRPNIGTMFQQDGECMERVVSRLVASKEVGANDADAFLHFSDELLEAEKAETNPLIEKMNTAEALYEGPNVKTIRDVKELRGVALNLIFMEKAEGEGFGKFMRHMSKVIKDPGTMLADKDAAYDELLQTYKHFVQLYKMHLQKQMRNETVHGDLHVGNMFRAPGFISVFDRAPDSIPLWPAEHTQLEKFMFAFQVCAVTGNVKALRDYYQHYQSLPDSPHPLASPEAVTILLQEMQAKLDAIKLTSQTKSVLVVDEVASAMSSVLGDAVQKHDRRLIPNALAMLANSNKKLSATFSEFQRLLAGSRQAKQIPITERTELMIALMVGWRCNRGKWFSQDSWKYFKDLFPRRDQGRPVLVYGEDMGDISLEYPSDQQNESLQYEKKFVYGVLGMNDNQARMANVLIPAGLILSPLVLRLGFLGIVKTGNLLRSNLSKVPEAIRFLNWYQTLPGPRESFNSFTSRLYASSLGSTFFQRAEPLKQLRSPLFRHTPGMLAGGAMVLGYQKFANYRAYKAEPKPAMQLSATTDNKLDYFHVFSP